MLFERPDIVRERLLEAHSEPWEHKGMTMPAGLYLDCEGPLERVASYIEVTALAVDNNGRHVGRCVRLMDHDDVIHDVIVSTELFHRSVGAFFEELSGFGFEPLHMHRNLVFAWLKDSRPSARVTLTQDSVGLTVSKLFPKELEQLPNKEIDR